MLITIFYVFLFIFVHSISKKHKYLKNYIDPKGKPNQKIQNSIIDA